MAIKVVPHLNLNTIQSHKVSYKGQQYSSMTEPIKIRGEVVNSPVSNMTGSVKVTKNAKINADISTMTGPVDISDSTVKGDIKTMSGAVDISDSTVGNIETKSGTVDVSDSIVNGNIKTDSTITLTDSEVNGKIETSADKLILKGKNTLQDLTITEQGGSGITGISQSVTGQRGSGITGISQSIIGQRGSRITGVSQSISGISGDSVNREIIIDGKRINPNELGKIAESVVPEFKLPSGNKITGILKFEGKTPGTLLLEEGAEFVGRLINGAVKHIR